VAFWARLVRQENGLFGFHEQGHGLPQKDFAKPSLNGVSA
jgi:hypothetical protein